MIFFLFIVYPILEIYTLYYVGSIIGMWPLFLFLVFSAFIGFNIVKSHSRQLLGQLQTQVASGKEPTKAMLQGLLVFLGGALLVVPGIISDFLGLMCILPGTRHLMALLLQKYLAKKIRQGSFRFQQMGPFQFAGGGSFKWPGGPEGGPTGERDVSPKVIDVVPLSSTTESKPEN